MARPRKVPEGEVSMTILRDGVFAAEDMRSDKGDKVTVPAEVAAELEAKGLAKRD